jgi:hypothetical protein|tara:strand:- start:676 stop:846 length:171 start_codon:yes stop_codon:yes gene_type:complete
MESILVTILMAVGFIGYVVVILKLAAHPTCGYVKTKIEYKDKYNNIAPVSSLYFIK